MERPRAAAEDVYRSNLPADVLFLSSGFPFLDVRESTERLRAQLLLHLPTYDNSIAVCESYWRQSYWA